MTLRRNFNPVMYILLFLVCMSCHFLSINAAPKEPLVWRQSQSTDSSPANLPPLIYPDGNDKSNCPTQYTNLFNQGIQKRTLPPPRDQEPSPAPPSALRPREFSKCQNIAHFAWTNHTWLMGDTQDLYLWSGSTYFFTLSASVPIHLMYAWTADYGSDNYTVLATGGHAGNTGTIQFSIDSGQGKHIHFQAFAKESIESGMAAVLKQDN